MRKFIINGKEVNGEVVNFTMVQEPFSIYQLEDGNFVKGKTVVLKIIRLEDKNLIDGSPNYFFMSQFVASADEGV
jgi:hypothetical protein